ncbi:molybdenum cofactor biosysynthesis protein [Elstera litoralis]|uniref:Molybdenum cofactor biosysynthesis protein n=1 Tax=Elstera litoralis TaxID=552518 RepID=A0A0F3IRV8_9PROT|nr:MOSC domain-containing protein [Elstera litoralis]KJV09357.1 molybdenum cofactor biosysynthesis protein [Elstera litoralis]
MPTLTGAVVAVSLSPTHRFSKSPQLQIHLRAGFGVEGDAHAGTKVKHRSRVRKDPDQPNLRQVHLIHTELFEELAAKGFDITPGAIGENIATRGLDLLALPQGTRLAIGPSAIVEITGLRNPCAQLDNYKSGLTQAVLDRDAGGALVRKSGVMSIVIAGGAVQAGDAIQVILPPEPHRPLAPV